MDTTLYRDINRFAVQTPWAHEFMKVFAIYGVGVFAVLVLVAWWYARYTSNPQRAVAAAVWAGAGTLVAFGLNQFIVAAVHRPRPYVTMSGVEVLVSRTHDFSFPSDHAVTAGAALTGLWIVAYYGTKAIRRLALMGTILALLVVFARVYVGAHYPSDVVVGLLVGTCVVMIGWFVLRKVLTHLAALVARQIPIRSLVIGNGQPPLLPHTEIASTESYR